MWHLIRIMVVALAVVGFVGQTTARAMPMMMAPASASVAAATMAKMDCADMPGMADIAKAPVSKDASKPVPCKGMTPDCMGKMGCATVAPPVPDVASLPHSVSYEGVTFAVLDLTREGVGAWPLYDPPRPQA